MDVQKKDRSQKSQEKVKSAQKQPKLDSEEFPILQKKLSNI